MGKLCRHAFATVACLLFVFLWLTAGNPDAANPWIAALAQVAPCALNPTACEQKPGNTGGEIGTAVDSSVQGPAEPAADGLRNPRPRGGS